MKNIIQLIKEHKFTEAEDRIDSLIPLIMEKKIFEMKKAVAAKMSEQMGVGPKMQDKRESGVVEEEDRPHQLNALEKLKDAEVTRKVNILTNVKNTIDSTDKALGVLGVKSNSADSNKIQGQIDSAKKTRPYNEEKEEKSEEDDDKEEKEEELDEARISIVRARVRGGKIQRRKKVSNVPGMTLRGGTLKRMSAAERRRRKMGARKGKMKRKAKLSRSLMKRKRSLQKRKSLGL